MNNKMITNVAYSSPNVLTLVFNDGSRLTFDRSTETGQRRYGRVCALAGISTYTTPRELIGKRVSFDEPWAAGAPIGEPTPEVVEALASDPYRIITRPGGRIGTYTTHGVYDDKHALIAEFTDPDDAQVFVNAKRFIDEVLAQRRLTITDAGRMLLTSTTKET